MSSLRRFKIIHLFLFYWFTSPLLLSAKPVVPIEIFLVWEGRELQVPNLEAISKFRELEPDIPVVHLFSPDYFLNQESRTANLEKIQTLLHDKDEVGLYLTSQRRVLNLARVIPRSTPTFWSHLTESRYCDEDCGLDVPLHVFSREDLIKIFTVAESSLRKAGFTRLKTFTVRGGFYVPLISEIAYAYGFRSPLYQTDPSLYQKRFDQYPLAEWASNQTLVSQGRFVPLVTTRQKKEATPLGNVPGGFVELQEISEILQRFSAFLDKSKDQKLSGFQVYLSQETAYIGIPRLKALVDGMRDASKSRDLDCEFKTHSGEKNGRPQDVEQRITTNL